MNILQSILKDASEILELQKLAYQSEAVLYNDFNLPPLKQTLEELQKDFLNHTFLGIKLEQQIVANVRVRMGNKTCFVGRLIVHPKHQGRGLGSSLMLELEERFGFISRFELFTGHLSLANIRLYEKLGYHEFKRETISAKLQFVYPENLQFGVNTI